MMRMGLLLGAAAMLVGAAPVEKLRPMGTLVSTGRISTSGLHGKWRMVVDLRDGRFSTGTDLSVIKSAEIYDGHTHWRVDRSGGSHRLDSPFARRRARTSAWLSRFGWLQPDFGGARRSPLTVLTEDGVRFSVFKVTPTGGEPVEMWFDAKTGLLAKTVEQDWFRKPVTRYGDYRDVNGQKLPFSITRAIGADEERITIDAYRLIRSAPADSYSAPRQPDDHALPTSGTTVTATAFPQLVVEASINGRPMAFLFDTGGHSILSPEAARSLGLASVGDAKAGGTGAGTVTEQFTRVAELRIGEAVMRDQVFSVIDLGYGTMERGERPPVAGLLGLEVVERFITRLDYRRGTLTLLPRDRPVACASGWLPTRFSDDMPTIDAVLDGVRAPFTIDTGNNGSTILYAHWLQSNRLADRYSRGLQTISYGAGGASHNWVSYADTFSVGGETVRHPMVRTTDDKGGVALSVSEAGNLGTDTLGNYTITFDYGRSRICMDFVDGYRQVPVSRAGMRVIKTDPETILVSFVNDDGPAALAGIRKGDRLLKVDRREARSLGGGELSRIFTQDPGSRVELEYSRDGHVTVAEIVLRELMPAPREGR